MLPAQHRYYTVHRIPLKILQNKLLNTEEPAQHATSSITACHLIQHSMPPHPAQHDTSDSAAFQLSQRFHFLPVLVISTPSTVRGTNTPRVRHLFCSAKRSCVPLPEGVPVVAKLLGLSKGPASRKASLAIKDDEGGTGTDRNARSKALPGMDTRVEAKFFP